MYLVSRGVNVNDIQYQEFVHEHRDEIVALIKELDNFNDMDISFHKIQLVRAINIRKHMPVIPFDEIKQLLIAYIAIRFIEEELGFIY